MKRVTGIGGIFFKSRDPKATKEWYEKHLGIEPGPYGSTTFEWREKDNPERMGYTVWGPFSESSDYFDPSESRWMVNYRVENLEALLEALRAEGVEVVDKVEEYEYGKFGWIFDPEGNKIELWQPPDEDKIDF